MTRTEAAKIAGNARAVQHIARGDATTARVLALLASPDCPTSWADIARSLGIKECTLWRHRKKIADGVARAAPSD